MVADLSRRSPAFACLLATFAISLLGTESVAAEVVLHVPSDVATLQQAIDSVPDGGTIELAAGTYAAPAASFVISNEGRGFTVRAAPAATVVLDGQAARTILKFTNTSSALGKPVVFERLTFANGRSSTDAQGGGVTLRFAEATFRECVFQNNTSVAPSTGGGGVLAYDQARVFLVDTVFQGNVAKNEGAGFKLDGTNSPPSVAFFHRCTFDGNLANPSGHRNTSAGGAIHVGNADAWIMNSRFTGNQAGYVGGAVYGIGTWANPVTTPRTRIWIANSTFVGNRSLANGSTPPDSPEAGAVHAEDQTTMKIWNSRFLENSAGLGGAAAAYRSILEIRDSVFRGNRATASGAGTGFGGAIAALSNDTGVDGATNRRSVSVLVERSLFQGRFGGTTTSAQSGGCLYVAGDVLRRNGSVPPQVNDPTLTRAAVSLQDVVFDDCDVASAATIPNGGGFELFHVTATLNGVHVLESDALGSGSGGGGGRIYAESVATLTDVVFSGNSAVQFGGALYLAGADVDITAGAFVHNTISGFGSALFVTGLEQFPTAADDQDAFGQVTGVLFADNAGGPDVWDDDSDNATRFYNDVRYDSNTFWRSSGNVYGNSIAGQHLPAGLNSLVVSRVNFPDTDKSTVANSAAGASPQFAALRVVPPETLAVGAVGDTSPFTDSFAGIAWSGASATLDGSPVNGFADLIGVASGSHTLTAGSATSSDTLGLGPTPQGTLIATPNAISPGQSSLLTWNTTAGDELAGAVDQGVAAPGTSDGSTSLMPGATTTWMFLGLTEQGAARALETIFVGELSLIFEDGFEIGDTTAWSSTSP